MTKLLPALAVVLLALFAPAAYAADKAASVMLWEHKSVDMISAIGAAAMQPDGGDAKLIEFYNAQGADGWQLCGALGKAVFRRPKSDATPMEYRFISLLLDVGASGPVAGEDGFVRSTKGEVAGLNRVGKEGWQFVQRTSNTCLFVRPEKDPPAWEYKFIDARSKFKIDTDKFTPRGDPVPPSSEAIAALLKLVNQEGASGWMPASYTSTALITFMRPVNTTNICDYDELLAEEFGESRKLASFGGPARNLAAAGDKYLEGLARLGDKGWLPSFPGSGGNCVCVRIHRPEAATKPQGAK